MMPGSRSSAICLFLVHARLKVGPLRLIPLRPVHLATVRSAQSYKPDQVALMSMWGLCGKPSPEAPRIAYEYSALRPNFHIAI